jgi:excisionase family DNA binding protein
MKKQQEYYSVDDILELLPFSQKRTVLKKIRSGAIPATKWGRQYLIYKKDFQKFMQNNQVIGRLDG